MSEQQDRVSSSGFASAGDGGRLALSQGEINEKLAEAILGLAAQYPAGKPSVERVRRLVHEAVPAQRSDSGAEQSNPQSQKAGPR